MSEIYWYTTSRHKILFGLIFWERAKNFGTLGGKFRFTVGILFFIPIYRSITR